MRKNICLLFLIFASTFLVEAQNALVFNGGYLVLNGGTGPSTGGYVVVNQAATTGISRTASGGGVISESQFNYVKWLNGATASGAYTLPFYQNASNYIPFTINKTSGATDISVSTWATNAANSPLPLANGNTLATGAAAYPTVITMNSAYGGSAANVIDRFWDINSNGAVNGTLQFYYLGAENTPALVTMRAQQWAQITTDPTNTTWWDWNPPTAVTTNPGVTTGIGNTAFGAGTNLMGFWILVDQTIILEESMVTSNLICDEQTLNFSWEVENEKNTHSYIIEKSKDGIQFVQEYLTPAQTFGCTANCSAHSSYTYSKINEPEYKYYRISKVSENMLASVIKVIHSDCASTQEIKETKIFAFNNIANVQVSSNRNEVSDLFIYDVQGKLISSYKLNVVEGYNDFTIPMESLANGTYVFQLRNNNQVVTKKLVKTN